MTTGEVPEGRVSDPHHASLDATGLAGQVQYLVDRALIGDLLVEFARSLDEKDWETYSSLYVPDGQLTVADKFVLTGHEELRLTGSAAGLGGYWATWHLSSNHAIKIEGDTATTRSYLLGVHLLDQNSFRHADGAGWYDCTLRRLPEGWRFVTVRLTEIWNSGEELPHIRATPTWTPDTERSDLEPE